jgi:uncharacterized protein DUF4390
MKIAATLFVVLSIARVAAADVRVTPLVREGRVWVSFGVADGLTPDLRQAVFSGLPVTFTYDIDLRRGVAFWPDRVIKTVTIAITVTFDTLTRRHALVRTFDGRIEATKSTEDEAEVRRWLTGLDAVPLFPTSDLEANTEYYVRVRARTKPQDSIIFWPWDSGLVSTNANFTFIP